MAKAKAPALFEDGELAPAPDNIVRAAQDCYNETAKGLPWRQSTSLTEARQKALRRAIQDYGGLTGFRTAMARAAKSPFLLGHTGRTGVYKNWRPTLAFFCQPKSIENLLDGVYDPEPEEPKKLILPTTWRPPVPKPFVQTETLEQRLAASIVSYRKIGNYGRANEIELKLAALEERPPVLVPAPEVAHLGMPEKPAAARPAPIVSDVFDQYDAEPLGDEHAEP